MKNIFRKVNSRKDIQDTILDELIEIKEILKENQNEQKSTNWIILSLEDDIKKLKEDKKDLQNQIKKYQKKEGD